MDPSACKIFRENLATYGAWTQSVRFEARAPPFDDKEARAVYELYRAKQWDHLLECEKCRDLNTYTDPCLRYEAAQWMDTYSHECWVNDRDYFMEGVDPVIKVVVQGEFGPQWVEHARTCPRHQHEYQALKQAQDEIMAAADATLKMMRHLASLDVN